jgi:hypothetical protein
MHREFNMQISSYTGTHCILPRLGYSKKGWTDGEIGVEWIKIFEEQTRQKANGRDRLLLVDGHNSHYTRGFLEYARQHHIHILCYPAHATHVYQGLDVVIFGPLKVAWTQERDRFERDTRQKVTKENFLAVYGAAHVKTLTAQNIQAAFRKTGVAPFNPNVVTVEMMAPSLETSSYGTLPLIQPSPVRRVATIFNQLVEPPAQEEEEMDIDAPHSPVNLANPFLATVVQSAVNSLVSSSASFLVNQDPIASTSAQPPAFNTVMLSPAKGHYQRLLGLEAVTVHDLEYQAALREAEVREAHFKGVIAGLQSAALLQGRYCDTLHHQLAAQEEKSLSKKKGKLVGDGLPRLLTDPEFIMRVQDHEDTQEREAVELETRKANREMRAEAMKEWKKLDAERKLRNNEIKARFKEEMNKWETERDRAKCAKQKPAWKKPTRAKLIPPVPKPAKTAPEPEDEDEDDQARSSDDGEEND